jgi:hypothetical protein
VKHLRDNASGGIMRTLLVSFVVVLTTIALHTSPAMADCNCVAVAGALEAKVDGAIRAQVALADSLYARGDYSGALAIYARAQADTGAAVLLYAEGMTEWQLGKAEDARAHLAAYIEAGGNVDAELRARAQGAVEAIDSGVTTAVRDLGAGVGGAVGGVVGVGGGVAGGVAGEVRGTAAKPKKVAKGAAIVLGLVAVVAVVAISAEGIAARKPEVDFNKKYGVGLGIGAAVAGGSAIYLWGLTAATGAAGGVGCGIAGNF